MGPEMCRRCRIGLSIYIRVYIYNWEPRWSISCKHSNLYCLFRCKPNGVSSALNTHSFTLALRSSLPLMRRCHPMAPRNSIITNVLGKSICKKYGTGKFNIVKRLMVFGFGFANRFVSLFYSSICLVILSFVRIAMAEHHSLAYNQFWFDQSAGAPNQHWLMSEVSKL